MQKKSFPIRYYTRILFRRKWAVILPVLGAILMIPPAVLRTPSQYRASATVKRNDLAITRALPSGLMTADTPRISLEALRVEILTWQNLQRVILQTNLDPELTDPDTNPVRWQQKFAQLNRIISIRRVAQSPGVDLVEISASHRDPEMARRIVDGVSNNYMEEAQRGGREDLERLVDFLKDRTERNRAALQQAEIQLEKYHEKHFASLDDVKLSIRNRLLNLRTDEAARSLQIAELKNQLAEAEEQIADIPETVSEVITEPNPALAEMERQILNRRMGLVALQLRYTEEHPQVIQVKEEITELQAWLQQTPDRVLQTEKLVRNPMHQQAASDIMSLRQQIRSQQAALLEIGARIEANDQSLRQVASDEKHYRDFQRDRRQYSDLYSAYQSSLIAAQTRMEVDTDAKYGTRVDMISPPQTPALPERKTPRTVAAATLMGGFAVGFALLFLLEVLDRSIRDVEDASSYFGFPVLGSIPIIVTRRERERKRWIRFMLFSVVAVLAAGVVTAFVRLEQISPGTTETLLSHGRDFLERLVK